MARLTGGKAKEAQHSAGHTAVPVEHLYAVVGMGLVVLLERLLGGMDMIKILASSLGRASQVFGATTHGEAWANLKLHLDCVLEAELKLGPHVERPMVVPATYFESQKVAIAEPCSALLATRSGCFGPALLTPACLPPDVPNQAAPERAGSQLA